MVWPCFRQLKGWRLLEHIDTPAKASKTSTTWPARSQISGPTVRAHCGIEAKRGSDGCPMPSPKCRRPSQPGTVPHLTPTDPTPVLDWPPKPPLLLTESQSEDLGEYIVCVSKRLQGVGFERLVAERQGRLDFSSGMLVDLPRKASTFLQHIKHHSATLSLSLG
jgi:hypothetical protein